MPIHSVPRTYTEDKVKYVFRDVVDDDGVRKIQHLVKEPWGEEFWNDNDPPDSDLLSAARPYDQTQHEMERKTRVQHGAAPEASGNEKSIKKASSRKADAKKA